MSSTFSHQGMRDILLLSYYDLPHHLKTCLLYLSMYPEDYRIGREELIWRWIAEGFVTEVKGQTADQVAENYFNELVNRSLILPVRIRYDGWVHACRMHDMVLELIISLSAEENFASIVEGQQSYNGGDNKIRRLSVQSKHLGDEVMQEIMDKWSQVRSISFYGCEEQGIPHLHKLHSLRVLVFHYSNCLGNQHIKYIGSIFQLKFLSIHSLHITELPEDIGDLHHLQTLDISDSGITKLPKSIGRLQRLLRLLVDNRVELPNEIGDLQALQELTPTWNLSIKLMEALRRLPKLKKVGMHLTAKERVGHDTGRYKEALKSSLAALGKHGLQSLYIFNCEFMEEELMDILCRTVPCLQKLIVDGHSITQLPEQMASLVNLTYLSLRVARIKHEDLCILGDIPALVFSSLHVLHTPDERLTIGSQQFRCLQEFVFHNYGYRGGLEMLFLQDAMPELRRLHLYFAAQEKESKMGFEFCFEHLASLEHINVNISHYGATRSRVEAAEAAVRNAVSIHPGRPTLHLCVLGDTVEDEIEREDMSSEHGMGEVELLEEHS